jgi:hypothetical protein
MLDAGELDFELEGPWQTGEATARYGQRLRRDRFIRDRLRTGDPPWRVEELRAADLGQGAAIIARLRT